MRVLPMQKLGLLCCALMLTLVSGFDARADKDDDKDDDQAPYELKVHAHYEDKKDRMKLELKIDGLKKDDGILEFFVFDDETNALLATFALSEEDEKDKTYLTESIPCAVRVEDVDGNQVVDTEEVHEALPYCDDNGLLVTLQGQVAYGPGDDAQLIDAQITALVDGYRFGTMTDDVGNYVLAVRGVDPCAFLEIQAQGTGEQSHIQLQSLVGELGGLAGLTYSCDAPLALESPALRIESWLYALLGDLSQWFIPEARAQDILEVEINNVTTALAAIINANKEPGEELSDEEVEALVAEADPVQILQIAAVVSLVSDPESGVTIPEGQTLEETVAKTVTALEEGTPLNEVVDVDPVVVTEPIEEVVEEVAEEVAQDPGLFPDLETADILGDAIELRLGSIVAYNPFGLVNFVDGGSGLAGTGERIDDAGRQAFNWELTPEGTLVVSYPAPTTNRFLAFVPRLPPEPGEALGEGPVFIFFVHKKRPPIKVAFF